MSVRCGPGSSTLRPIMRCGLAAGPPASCGSSVVPDRAEWRRHGRRELAADRAARGRRSSCRPRCGRRSCFATTPTFRSTASRPPSERARTRSKRNSKQPWTDCADTFRSRSQPGLRRPPMFDDLLEERLRSALRQAGDELSLSVTAAELERRLTLRRRARTAQRSALLAAARRDHRGGRDHRVGAVVVPPDAEPGRGDSESAADRPCYGVAARPASASPEPIAPATPAGRAPIIRYLTQDWHAFEIAVDGTGRRAVPSFDINPELGVLPEDPWPRDGECVARRAAHRHRQRRRGARPFDRRQRLRTRRSRFRLGDSPGEGPDFMVARRPLSGGVVGRERPDRASFDVGRGRRDRDVRLPARWTRSASSTQAGLRTARASRTAVVKGSMS